MRTKRITLIAMLTAFALIIFIIEAQIPPLAPIPGIKLGLANVITLFAMSAIGKKDAFLIMILRVILGNLFAGSVMSCMYSLTGGIVCFAFMSAAMPIFKDNKLWCVSVCGAIGHNIGQILVAVAITNTLQIAWYLPILMLSAVVTGAFTGVMAQFVLKSNYVKYMMGEAR